MRIPQWSPALSVCNPLLDEQHITLLELGRAVLQDIERQPAATDADLRIALLDLHAFACRHVADEEAILARCGAPDLDEHRVEHQAALQRLRVVCETVPGRDLDRRAVVDCLIDWMTRHVTEFDLPLSACLRTCPPLPARKVLEASPGPRSTARRELTEAVA